MTTSLPIIPQRQTTLPQRPRLRLDTQSTTHRYKGSSLRLETLSAVSPTIRNTFSNAYEPPASAAPVLARPSKPRLSIDSTCKTSSESSTPSSAATPSSSLTSASTDSATIVIPYKQPHNLTSILSNSPARALEPRRMAAARPLFPAEKKVSFRTPLEEEIKNVRYTLAHSDIESSQSTISSLSTAASSESESSAASLSVAFTSSGEPSSPSVQSPSEPSSSSAFSSLEGSPRPKGPRAGDKRDSSESESDSCPETPVAGRRKRRRDWRWTLGSLPSDKSTSSSASDAITSEDSN
ncbi:hypothetical protein BU26DRAFT_558386 [Trematosphaeria pertusa]|uniref:Uncharacterized protein n=1 Tax=Trematosphaeria pertusa TaxID=390896 RepID=A0A6A6J311_9PLEO|nr:uncharacterized protein BU26DRAFT_558386 [Trematosphaeria pertusa]KAF2256958.1 hypothetical protein BU26DRAFT_558386 [Trematosphaeria pertusa]